MSKSIRPLKKVFLRIVTSEQIFIREIFFKKGLLFTGAQNYASGFIKVLQEKFCEIVHLKIKTRNTANFLKFDVQF